MQDFKWEHKESFDKKASRFIVEETCKFFWSQNFDIEVSDLNMQSITGTATRLYIGDKPINEEALAGWQHSINTDLIEIARLNALKNIFSKIFGITDCSDFVIDEFDRPVKIRQTNYH